jgi:hypothetical protein
MVAVINASVRITLCPDFYIRNTCSDITFLHLGDVQEQNIIIHHLKHYEKDQHFSLFLYLFSDFVKMILKRSFCLLHDPLL